MCVYTSLCLGAFLPHVPAYIVLGKRPRRKIKGLDPDNESRKQHSTMTQDSPTLSRKQTELCPISHDVTVLTFLGKIHVL